MSHLPKVSVFILTYNQQDYVGQMMDSILAQRGDFSLELVIGDDASSDGTTQLIEDFAVRYPGKIRLLKAEKNMGLSANFLRTFAHCDGDYVAICDGDDYWITTDRLQQQIQLMQSEPGTDIVFGRKDELYSQGDIRPGKSDPLPDSDFDDLVFDNYIPSVTCVFRNKSGLGSPPVWIDGLPYGDWPLYLWLLVDGGKIRFLDKTIAVYRKTIGQSAKLRKRLSDAIRVKHKILKNCYGDDHFSSKKAVIYRSMVQTEQQLMGSFLREKQWGKAVSWLMFLVFVRWRWNAIRSFAYGIKKHLE